MSDFQFTNDFYWKIIFISLHENPPMEDEIIMTWTNDIPPNEAMIEAILTKREELARYKHHIRVQRYHQVDTALVFNEYNR